MQKALKPKVVAHIFTREEEGGLEIARAGLNSLDPLAMKLTLKSLIGRTRIEMRRRGINRFQIDNRQVQRAMAGRSVRRMPRAGRIAGILERLRLMKDDARRESFARELDQCYAGEA
jgi:hypothetical protein